MNLDTIKIKLYHKRVHKKGLNSNLFLIYTHVNHSQKVY